MTDEELNALIRNRVQELTRTKTLGLLKTFKGDILPFKDNPYFRKVNGNNIISTKDLAVEGLSEVGDLYFQPVDVCSDKTIVASLNPLLPIDGLVRWYMNADASKTIKIGYYASTEGKVLEKIKRMSVRDRQERIKEKALWYLKDYKVPSIEEERLNNFKKFAAKCIAPEVCNAARSYGNAAVNIFQRLHVIKFEMSYLGIIVTAVGINNYNYSKLESIVF